MIARLNSAAAALALTLPLALSGTHTLQAAEESEKVAESLPAAQQTETESQETSPSNGMKTFDAVAVRPVTFVSSVFSAGAFVLALPFAALDPAMDVETTRKNLVEQPFQETFQRPLGDFNGSAW
jgi:hypothetical protein